MKKWLIFLLITPVILPAVTKKMGRLPDLINAKHLLKTKTSFIITDYPHIYIYSAPGLKRLRKFGSLGQGPGEFYIDQEWMDRKVMGLLSFIDDNHLYVNSMGRISIFTLQGDLVRTRTLNSFGGGYYFRPFAGGFVGFQIARQKRTIYVTLNRYDPELKKGAELMRQLFWIRSRNIRDINFFERANGSLQCQVFENLVYVVHSSATVFKIEVLDGTGKWVRTISHPQDPRPVPPTFAPRVHRYFRHKFKRGTEHNIKYTRFGKVFPAIRQFRVIDNKIFVLTYKRQGNQNEMLIMDLTGRLLRKLMVPAVERNPEHLFPFFIDSHGFYQLREDEESEIWELWVTDFS